MILPDNIGLQLPRPYVCDQIELFDEWARQSGVGLPVLGKRVADCLAPTFAIKLNSLMNGRGSRGLACLFRARC